MLPQTGQQIYNIDVQVPRQVYTFAPADMTDATGAVGNVPGLAFNVLANIIYHFRFVVNLLTGAATTTGFKLAITCPAFVANMYAAYAQITGFAADGAASTWIGTMVASGDTITSTDTKATTKDYLAIIEGIIQPSAAGVVQLQYGSEVAASTTLKMGSFGILTQIW